MLNLKTNSLTKTFASGAVAIATLASVGMVSTPAQAFTLVYNPADNTQVEYIKDLVVGTQKYDLIDFRFATYTSLQNNPAYTRFIGNEPGAIALKNAIIVALNSDLNVDEVFDPISGIAQDEFNVIWNFGVVVPGEVDTDFATHEVSGWTNQGRDHHNPDSFQMYVSVSTPEPSSILGLLAFGGLGLGMMSKKAKK